MSAAAKKRRRYTQLTVKEVSGVDVPAQEGAKIVFRKRAELVRVVDVAKAATLTSVEAGHSHLVRCVDEMQNGQTDSSTTGTTDSYSGYHSHPWVKNADGSFTIGTVMGHSHEMLGADTIARAADDGLDPAAAMKRGTPDPTPTPVPAASAAPTPTPTTTTKQEPTMAMTPEEQAELARAKALASMSDVQKRHHARLDAPAQQAFEKASPAERQAAVDADKVVFVAKHGHLKGREFRASDEAANPDTVALARSVDDEAEKRIAAEKRSTRVETEKRAQVEVSAFGGTLEERVELLEVIDAGAAAMALPVEKRTRLLELIKGANGSAAITQKTLGTASGGDATGSPVQVFKAGLAAYAKEQGLGEAQATQGYIATDKGAMEYEAAFPLVANYGG